MGSWQVLFMEISGVHLTYIASISRLMHTDTVIIWLGSQKEKETPGTSKARNGGKELDNILQYFVTFATDTELYC